VNRASPREAFHVFVAAIACFAAGFIIRAFEPEDAR
jgi:hypothetical protein